MTPLVASRAGPPTLYLGGDVIFKTANRGASWTIISPDLTGKRAGAQRCDGNVAIPDAMSDEELTDRMLELVKAQNEY